MRDPGMWVHRNAGTKAAKEERGNSVSYDPDYFFFDVPKRKEPRGRKKKEATPSAQQIGGVARSGKEMRCN